MDTPEIPGDTPTERGSDTEAKLSGALEPPLPPGQGSGPHLAQVVYAQPPGDPRKFRRGRWLGGFRVGLLLVLVIVAFTVGVYGGMVILGSRGGPVTTVHQSGDKRHTIAIVPIEGTIDTAMARFVAGTLRELGDRDEVKAVILRVVSPGGYVTPSDEIARAVLQIREKGKPVLASYGDVAASGGYYCSVHSDEIFAQPTTITGSIGVIGQAMVFAGLMEKIGVQPHIMVADGSPKKRLANQTYETWTEEDMEQYQVVLDWFYDKFFATVLQGRGEHFEDPAVLQEICNGLAYTADDALELKLIDKIGYLDDVIAAAEARIAAPSGVTPHVIRIDRRMGFSLPFLPIGSERSEGLAAVDAFLGGLADGVDADRLRALTAELSRPRAMYLMR